MQRRSDGASGTDFQTVLSALDDYTGSLHITLTPLTPLFLVLHCANIYKYVPNLYRLLQPISTGWEHAPKGG